MNESGANGGLALGLEGITVAETELSQVDGQRGRLTLRGHTVDELSGQVPFAEVAALFWSGSRDGGPALSQALSEARERAHSELLPGLGRALESPHVMDALRAGLGHLSAAGRDERQVQVGVTASLPVLLGAWARGQQGLQAVAPDPGLDPAAGLLQLLEGQVPSPARAAALDAYLVTVVDHGLNASTFAARVVASTRSDAVSAVVAALGALKGPLHGGAPGPVLDMLDAIGTPERARSWLEQELSEGRRIMGMGHRVYRVRDPRARVLEAALTRLEASGETASAERLRLARTVEREAQALLQARYPDRPLAANVEFATALLLEALGIPRQLFSAVFACGRVVGWLAHVSEERRRGRLIRPRAAYIGEVPSPKET